jgi:hypothetical protein
MIVRYADGSWLEGVIHRLERDTMRATVAGLDDAVEYTFVQGEWTSERGVGVTFEFASHRQEDLWLGLTGGEEPLCAAGGDCLLRRMPGTGPSVVN